MSGSGYRGELPGQGATRRRSASPRDRQSTGLSDGLDPGLRAEENSASRYVHGVIFRDLETFTSWYGIVVSIFAQLSPLRSVSARRGSS